MIYYEETYGGYYDATNEEEARAMSEYKSDCQGSFSAEVYGDPTTHQYQIMDARIEKMSEHEKGFYMLQLSRWYKEKLLKDMPTDADTKENLATSIVVSRMRQALEELDQWLCLEVF